MKKPYIKVFSYGKFEHAAQSLRAEKETRYYMGKKGNVAIITGASSGMGREFAIQIAQLYPSIQEFWIIARRKERLEELQEKLRQKLEAKTGKHVELTVKVEPDLIGGVKLTMGGVQYDGTVRHHLDELQRILQTNSN